MFLALLFFSIGMLVILNKAGLISPRIYATLMTWQALAVATGVYLLCTRQLIAGILITALGLVAMFNVFNLLSIIGTPGVLLIMAAIMMICYLRR